MSTFKYILKRLAFAALTFFIIISICCILVRMLPNPVVAQLGKDMNQALQGRGGGKPGFFQGSVKAAKADIEAFFGKLNQ